MSSEEEATAANVLSQMSQMQQVACETIEATVINVGHHCDVETSGAQGDPSADHPQEIFLKVDVPQQEIHAANPAAYSKPGEAMSVASTVTNSVPAPMRIPGSGAKIYHCEFCSKVFNKSYNLKTHIRVHTGERPFQCEVCGHGFANLGDLKRHARTHTGEKPFKCEYCSKVFSDFGSHKRHLRLHTGFKPFKCEQCDRQFTRLDSYKNHVRLHTGDRPYKCETCQKEFNYLTTYKRHLNIHKGEKPFSCEQCDKKFTRLNYLKNHMNTHAKLSTQECQTDVSIMVRSDSPDEEIDVDEQSGLEPREEETAAESLAKDAESRLENEADKSSNGMKEEEVLVTTGSAKPDSSKSLDASLLHQVTQVLGEIVPQSISAEVLESNGGPQIVVQGADQTGSEFKITLAQQLLIAQHILEQAQFQRAQNSTGETSEGQITTVTLPEISAELADQIVSQAAMHQANRSEQTSAVVIQREPGVDELEVSLATEQQSELVVESDQEELPQEQLEITQEGSAAIITEHVLEENTTVPIPVTSSGAVYVAIDPTQPDVQHLLGQIHMVPDVDSTQEVPVSQS